MASALGVVNYILCRRITAVSRAAHTTVFLCLNKEPGFSQNASYCTKQSIAKSATINQHNKVQVGFAEVVKENTKSIGYLGVIIGGLGIVAYMFYVLYIEVISKNSPNGIYSDALERCKQHSKVIDALGQPIKAYGEESRRGRRTHMSHARFVKDGAERMRMKFYMQGIRRRGTVTLEVQKNKSGDYEYRYLYVIVDDVMRTVIEIEDNRNQHNGYSDETALELS